MKEQKKKERGGGLKETVSNGSFGFLQAGDMFREMEAVGGKCKSQTHHCPTSATSDYLHKICFAKLLHIAVQ